MTPFVALLRAVNVGGKTMLPMADLRALAEAQGWADVKTLLQSGNLVFRAQGQAAELEQALEDAIAAHAGRRFTVLVRTPAQWSALIADNPYPDAARDDPSHLVALLLRSAPAAEAQDALRAAIRGREVFTVKGREAWFVYPDGIGDSKLTPALIDRHLGSGTGRNWNTVLKIDAALRALA
ncbi:DUF1697 domain-containing protein [Caulobacter sp. KR2-114]|uniref:DUF1697 domain-containing protein n=1 Tax=Caulobacter sp. KR2-114 TaxID=3400912 RepID=UPI003BFC90E6